MGHTDIAVQPLETSATTKSLGSSARSFRGPRTLPRSPTLRLTVKRYSVEKLRLLDNYCSHAPWWRVVLVLVAVPLPGLLTSILPSFLHLQPVSDGINVGFALHLASAVASSSFGFILTWLKVTNVPRAVYSIPRLCVVTLVTTVLYSSAFALFSIYVTFPMPFAWILGTPPLFMSLGIAHVLVLGSRVWRSSVLRTAFRDYVPSAIFQVSQIVLYPAVSVLFDNVSQLGQFFLTLAFPVFKYFLRFLLRRLSARLKDSATEVAVCGVEITASLYQSMIMQSSPSLLAMTCIIGIDVVQGLVMIKLFVDKYSVALPTSPPSPTATPAEATTGPALPYRHQLIPLARQLLRTTKLDTAADEITVAETTTATCNETTMAMSTMPLTQRRRTLTMALETLHVADDILLTQYIEVVVPFVNAIFLAVVTQLPSGRFNTRLAPFYDSSGHSTSSAALKAALQSIVLYSFLQALTLILTQIVLKRRYGISAVSYLGFILEHHGLSIIGKMMAWLPFVLHFTVIQYELHVFDASLNYWRTFVQDGDSVGAKSRHKVSLATAVSVVGTVITFSRLLNAGRMPPRGIVPVSPVGSPATPTPLHPRRTAVTAFGSQTHREHSERYSIKKFQELDAYCSSVTTARIILVLFAIPIPSLVASVVPCFLPLQDIQNGPNLAIVVHTGFIAFSSTFGLLLTWLEVTEVPRSKYSLRQLLAVCSITCIFHCSVYAAIAYYTYFPMPFATVVMTPPLLIIIGLSHGFVFGSRLWKDPVYLHSVRTYGPSVFFQMSQLVVYPAISIVFGQVAIQWQVALTLAFPLLKWILKKVLKKLSLGLKDCSAEVAVCGIEITGSMYQSMIMQTSPTLIAMVFIIGLDLVHGLFVIRMFMDKYSKALPRAPIASRISVARRESGSLQAPPSLPLRHQLIPLARELIQTSKVASDLAGLTVADRSTQVVAPTSPTRAMTLNQRRQILFIALETLYVGEEILLSEYFEVVIPFVNSIFIAVAAQLPSARYNSRLAPFYLNSSQLSSSLQSIALYSLLQGLTLIAFHWVLRLRYGISALSYLSFILERHALSIVGKTLGWLPFILHFNVVQYGVDFSFQFDWLKPHPPMDT